MFDPPLATGTILHHMKLGRMSYLQNGKSYAIPEDEALRFVAVHKAGKFPTGIEAGTAEKLRHAERELATFKTFADAQLMERVAREMARTIGGNAK